MLGALLAGCVPGAPGAAPQPAPDPMPWTPAVVSSIADPTGTGQLSPLPIAPFLLTNEQDKQLITASSVLVHTCMGRFGINYTPPKVDTPITDKDEETGGGYLPDSDPATAAAQGYLDRADAGQSNAGSDDLRLSQQVRLVLDGADPSPTNGTASPPASAANGQQIPAGGCLGEAHRTIAGNADPTAVFDDSELVSDIDLGGYSQALADSRVQAVFAQWSTCMATKGFHYASPVAAVRDPRWNPHQPASSLELRTASADATCKYLDNVNGVFHAVQVAFETAAIANNATALAKIQSGRTAALRTAVRIIARGR